MILTYLWPWNKAKVNQTWYTMQGPKRGCNHAKFQRAPSNSVRQNANVQVLSNQKTCQLSPLNMCKSENWWYMLIIYLTFLIILHKSDKNKKILVKTVRHCRDHKLWSRSLKVVWTSKAQRVVPSSKVWHLSHLWCPRKSVFDKRRHLIDQKHVNYLPCIHTIVT